MPRTILVLPPQRAAASPSRLPAAAPRRRAAAAWLPALLLAACAPRLPAPATPGAPPAGAQPERPATPPATGATTAPPMEGRLSTGVRLDPVAAQSPLGNFPLALLVTPDGRHALTLLSGWREQGLQVVDRATGRVTQTLAQPSAFLGLALSPDGRTIYTSGGGRDVVYRYDWSAGTAQLRDSIFLDPPAADTGRPRPFPARRYPAGLALSPDGATLYVAENLADSLAVVDAATGRVRQRFPMERYPYGVAVAADGTVYASAWGGRTVSAFTPAAGGGLGQARRMTVGRHPSALLLSRDGSRLFVASGSTDRVAVVDPKRGAVLKELLEPPPAGPGEGTTPNALALSEDGTRLFVAEADANAVAVFDLSADAAGVSGARGADRLAGRIPVAWYPTALAVRGDTLLVVNGKGSGSAPNPGLYGPRRPPMATPTQYSLGQLAGSLITLPGAAAAGETALAAWSDRVARANGWDRPVAHGKQGYPPFQHVIYVIKENRTFDQVFGDLPEADGDTALVFFPRAVSPNHHALAERFGIFDRFFVNAEVSADGHNWSTAAYATDYVGKTVPSQYSGKGRAYDYEGTNRGYSNAVSGDDDVAEPANGYLWDLAQRAGITFRNYGEFVHSEKADPDDAPPAYRGNKPFLMANTNPRFPGFDLNIPDQLRADVWLEDLAGFTRAGRMPALQVIRLPNDHTAGARAGTPTPRAYMADNDLALGRIIEGLSHSPFWSSTVVFVLEDDAQNGPDHVDAHRSPLLVISPYNRPGVLHRFANTTDVIATMAEILGLGSLSQFDYYGRPLRDVFAATPDTTPYGALPAGVPLDERNPSAGQGARDSERLELGYEDESDDDFFNLILWRAIKGDAPYPGARRAPALELRRGN
ncbi:MAG TPA: bifunctional YncE family protein/alkaline phosphatase family protein [Longimicrobiales bacterium]|nr:bifunctional YncE family protein/alkaline phosphatase family protein [Longimicrobiales bacterium]